jgi:hypothetical protein
MVPLWIEILVLLRLENFARSILLDKFSLIENHRLVSPDGGDEIWYR